MKLVSMTLTSSCEGTIGDALKSVVDWVDCCLVIDTGVKDRTLEVAREVAGDKLVVRPFEWRSDFAAARNFSLDAAHELGGDWAVTIDTDERIDPRGDNLRARLGACKSGVVMLRHDSGVYAKERFFRLPVSVRFVGPTHESYAAFKVGSETLPKAVFRELPKTAEQNRAKFERDVVILTRHTGENSRDPRWFYYLGDSYANLGQREAAIDAFDRCAALRGWDEESAWACYRAAESLVALGRFDEAVDRCAAGMARHAGIAELPWLAAFASYRKGNNDQAIYWANLAIPNGLFRGIGAKVPRIGFRSLSPLWEGPFDVLRWALRAKGDAAGAAEAEALYEQAREARVRSLG